jgi:hypothetical protein
MTESDNLKGAMLTGPLSGSSIIHGQSEGLNEADCEGQV